MKSVNIRPRIPSRWVWLPALVLASLVALTAGTGRVGAQTEAPPTAEVPPAPAAAAPPAAPATPDRAAVRAGEENHETEAEPGGGRGRRTRLQQLVAVGNNATVRTGQEAEEVVVVRGNAVIDGEVKGDVVVILGKATVNGRINGDLVVVMGEAVVNGEITGESTLVLSRSAFRSKANVHGQIMAVGVQPDIDASARIRGTPDVVSLGPLMRYFDWAKDYLFEGVFLLRPFPPRLGWVWGVAAMFLAIHLVIALLFAAPMRACMATLHEQPARSFMIGLVACILVGPVSLLLSVTVVATPLIWLVFFALCLFGRVAAYGATGAALGRFGGSVGLQNPVPAVLAGSVFFYLVYMVPILGFFVYWLVLPWGVGATLIRLYEALRRERRPVTPSDLGGGPIPGGGPGGPGGLAAASALSAGVPGPATHALVGDPPVFPAEPLPGERGSVPPPIGGPAPALDGGASPLPPPPPVPPLTAFEVAALPRVGFWPRFGATLIDVLGVAFVVMMTHGEVRMFWLLLGAYHFGMWGWKGTTLGGSILGLRLIRLDGRPIDWATAGVRLLGSVLSLLPLGIGFFWASWDDQCQSWHDRIAGTTIVKSDRRVSLV